MSKKDILPPFSSTYSPNIPELLAQLNISLVLSTYQAGKVIVLSARDNDHLVQLPRTFNTPMGIAVKDRQIALATKEDVVILANAPGLAKTYPSQPNTYDALFIPRSTYYTGRIALHDMNWTSKNELIVTNTLFSCLATIDHEYSFRPIWKPPFIDELAPEDRCHLNGLAMQDDTPRYVTALSQTNTYQGWRENKLTGGMLMDVESNEVILQDLPMPHSPRIYNDKLYVLLSAAGELVEVDVKAKTYEVINALGGFARGMAKYGDYLFIGMSKLRHTSSVFADLPIAKKSQFAGIIVVYLPMGNIIGHIKYENSVEEIYDVDILKDTKRPGLLSPDQEVHRLALSHPDADYWAAKNDT